MFLNLSLSLFVVLSFVSAEHKFPKFYQSKYLSGEKKESLLSKSFDDVKCEKQLKLFREALSAHEFWALKLFDTWGKINSGYLEENVFNLGRFTDCLNFQHDTHQADNEAIQGQYCLTAFVALPNSTMTTEDEKENGFDWREAGKLIRNQSLMLISGICLPKSCSPANAVSFINTFLVQADLVALNAQCQSNDPISFTALDIFATIIYAFFAMLMLSSTIYDVIARRSGFVPDKLFISFSAYTNGKTLFDITKSKSPNSINCLLGLRAISVFWIMFGHRLTTQIGFPVTNPREITEHYNHAYSVILSAFNISVDTFFVIGALLMTISMLNALDKDKLNIPKIICHRYIRYTPVLAALVLFVVSLSKFILNGPIEVTEFQENCFNYWWTSLLHVQNYVNPLEQCLGHAWYLSADFQLFLISPFLIYPAWKYGWKYLWSLPVLAVMSSVYVLIMSLKYDLRVFMMDSGKAEVYQQWIYNATHARLGPWMLGITLGFILQTTKDRKIAMSRRLNAFLWILTLSVMATVVMIVQPLRKPFNDTSLLANAFYIGFHRLAWSIALCWIIFACQKLKTGGIIRWFLSLPEWQPIGRMSLSMYLVHVLYQTSTILNIKHSFTFEIVPMLHIFWGDIMVTLVLGALVYLMFEAPFLLIESYFYNRHNLKHK